MLVALVSRLDLDSDARINRHEFSDGIMPIENFTKGSAGQFKSVLEKEVKHHRPATAAPKYKPSKMSNLLHGTDTKNERDFLKQQTKYTD